jgi:hypothetical protein
MATYSQQVEQWRPLVSKYFAPQDVDNALAIMAAESRGIPTIPSGYNAGGTENSWGLFQININAHGGTPQQWSSPEANVKKAAELYYGAGNWRDWQNTATALGLPTSGSSGGQRNMVTFSGLGSGGSTDPYDYGTGGATSSPYSATPKYGSTSSAPAGYNTSAALAEQAKALEQELANLQRAAQQTDANGDPTYEAMQASKRINTVQDNYRQVLQALASAQAREDAANQPKPMGKWQNPFDGSWWTTDPITGEPVKQISPALPGYVPGRGVPAPSEARESWSLAKDPATGQTFRVNLATGQKEPFFGASQEQMTPYQQADLAWRKANEEIQERRLRDQMAQARLAQQENLSQRLMDSIMTMQTQTAPMAMRPGQVYHAGFEAGGPYERLLNMTGGARDAGTGKVVPVTIDPAALWEQSRRQAGL